MLDQPQKFDSDSAPIYHYDYYLYQILVCSKSSLYYPYLGKPLALPTLRVRI